MRKITLTILEDEQVHFPKRISKRSPKKYKYAETYKRIEENVNEDNWIILDEFDSFREGYNLYNCVSNKYRKNYIVRFYKYGDDGEIDPRIYVRKKTDDERKDVK